MKRHEGLGEFLGNRIPIGKTVTLRDSVANQQKSSGQQREWICITCCVWGGVYLFSLSFPVLYLLFVALQVCSTHH